jgi:hypothetical protein
MKNRTSKTKVKGVGEIQTPETNPVLLHLLSPLERAAYKHEFKRFFYNLDGLPLEVTPEMSRKLFYQSERRVNDLRDLLQGARIKQLKQLDENTRRFLLKPLRHHGLPIRLYHVLRGKYCRTMEDVAEKGEHGLRSMRGIGKQGLAIIRELFVENGCGSLFT